MQKRRIGTVALALMAALAWGCSDSDSDGNSGTNAPAAVSTARSTTCLAVQDAECDWLADRCLQLSRAECDDSFQAVFCKSDEVVNACLQALPSAPCGASPAVCKGIADPAPAISLCNQLSDLLCARVEGCGATTKASCLTQVATTLPCPSSVGIAPSYDSCVAELAAAACNAQKGVDLPASCKGVVKRLSSSSTSPSSHPALGIFLEGVYEE